MRIPCVPLALLVAASFPCLATPATITIDAGKDVVPVNPLLFGTNLHANDESGEPIKAFIRDVGVSVFRYPDGGGYYYLDRPGDGWGSGQSGLGAKNKLAASYLGCFKNVARFAAETGCRLTACVNVENGSVDAAVAWVRYAKQEKLGITHWCLGNEVFQEKIFGLIPGWCEAEGWGGNPWNGVTIRPKALAMKLWTKHMARGSLVETRIVDDGILTQSASWHNQLNYTGREFPALSAYCTRDEGRRRLTLMVINKKPNSAVDAEVTVKDFVPVSTAKLATLNGPDYLSHNDDGSTYRSVTPAPAVTVRITESAIEGAGPTFRYKFPAHSITVIELLARQEGK